ncbi:MAG TPA: LLM class flavin-dependent oxidoreductase [Acidimicrobiales bacterium]|nr:LLM class flavin-dependent oxidoreductase [Acidimicrobiales bacterium]
MRFGVLLPHIVPYADRATLEAWCAGIEAGPYDTVVVGERLVYDNLDHTVSLTAAALLTSRPSILFGLSVMPLHAAAVVAKQLASVDVLSQGRLRVAVGVGGRPDDYEAAERPMRHRHARLDEQVAALRRTWAEAAAGPGRGVGPAPLQAGGPPIYSSARGPKSLARAARWADGNYGGSMPLSPEAIEAKGAEVRAAWSQAGRVGPPYLMDGVWFALGPDSDELIRSAGERYFGDVPLRADFRWTPALAPCSGEAKLEAMIRAYEAAGWDELILIPTSPALDQLDRLSTFLLR